MHVALRTGDDWPAEGSCGVGKTWLACALAQAACREGVTMLYKRTTRLFDELELAHGEPLLLTLLARHIRPQDVHYQWWTLISTLYGPSEQGRRTLTLHHSADEIFPKTARAVRRAWRVTRKQRPAKIWGNPIGPKGSPWKHHLQGNRA